LTAKNPSNPRYSYGWHRAEILAALINGVFLLALCFSISLEALGRFFSTPGRLNLLATSSDFTQLIYTTEITNPKLVVIVGSFGLASNIVGLFLFHGGHPTVTKTYIFNYSCQSMAIPMAALHRAVLCHQLPRPNLQVLYLPVPSRLNMHQGTSQNGSHQQTPSRLYHIIGAVLLTPV
jgi:Co/Zn/Cd efflux system component